MDGYVTGGKHGDGSVFSLDLTEVSPHSNYLPAGAEESFAEFDLCGNKEW